MTVNASEAAAAIAIFNRHNEVLSKLWQHHHADAVQVFLNGAASGQMDFPRIRIGNVVGGIFAA